MLLNVNPTRMELLRLRQRLLLAKRGHKLLKDKLEGLMRNFLTLANSYIEKRANFDKKFTNICAKYYSSIASFTNSQLKEIFSENNFSLNLLFKESLIMNVCFPVFESSYSGVPISYPLALTNETLDGAFVDFLEILHELIELASLQQQIYLISSEISKTRRRVNALEYVMIPNLEQTTKYITSKLEEMERGNISRLLKMKDIIRGH